MSNCYQWRVTINNCYSNLLPVVSGVLQGSILGPLLFLVYINDMSSYIHHSQFLKFADDTKINVFFLLVLCLTTVPCRKMSLLYLPAWSWVDFNFKKFVHLSFKCKLDTSSDRRIPRYDSHKDLGLILSEDLYWDKHHKAITARAYKVLGLYNTSHYSLFSFYFHNGQTV